MKNDTGLIEVGGGPRFILPPTTNGYGGNGSARLGGNGAIIKQPAVELPAEMPIFASEQSQAIIRIIEKIGPSDISVFLHGETGTGKEVYAMLVHQLSNRAGGKFVPLNCAGLPRELFESELFGHVKGAFTGANEDREGLFQKADGGTLLLDEITEMPMDMQAKLLRVLQDKKVRQVGSKVDRKVDCRIIATTNRDVEQAIRDGKLREDLKYRLGISITIPRLRERKADIIPLAQLFLKRFIVHNPSVQGFTTAALKAMTNFSWPGNVRQLENEIYSAVLLADQFVDVCHLLGLKERKVEKPDKFCDLQSTLDQVERGMIVTELRKTGWNKEMSAKGLGISRRHLYRRMKHLKIELKDFCGKEGGN